MLALLVGGGAVYLLLGDLKEAVILLAFATMSILITVVQESRTERVLEALRDLTSPRALVIRDGERKRIAGREVVRGDLVVIAEGDRVPADATLVECQGLRTDESLLTGESVPVRKVAQRDRASLAGHRPGGDDLPCVFSGSLVVSGTGIGEVIAIGALSEIGRIGQSLSTLETEQPRLQQQTRRLVRVFALVGAAVSILAVLLYGTLRGGWLDAVLGGIALGISMLPEEFPVVLTVFMAMGAWRISRARVLTRRAAAIETLGSATVLCTDKTGHAQGLRPDLLAVSHVWQPVAGRQEFVVAAKGATEAIAELCRLDAAGLAELTQSVDAMAAEGLRMLGVARSRYAVQAGQALPDTPRDFAFEFLGLVGLADPLRASVAAAVSECRSAGIKVVMITGDYPATARVIARQAGLDADDLVTGQELEALSTEELAARVRSATASTTRLRSRRRTSALRWVNGAPTWLAKRPRSSCSTTTLAPS